MLLVDSGATFSVIPKKIWLNITNGGSQLDGHQGEVSAANGGGMGILGKWQTVCQFDSLALVAEFLVADVPSQEVLLGFDFLHKYGAVVDFAKNECKIMGKCLPLIVPADLGKPHVVTVPVDTVIPPRSETIIEGRVGGVMAPGREGMFEPADSVSEHCNVMVARVVCKVEQGSLPVRVINVTDDALTLKGGVKVGTLHTDIEVGKKAEHLGMTDTGEGSPVSWSTDSLLDHLGLTQKGFEAPELSIVRDLLYNNLEAFSTGDNDLGRTQYTMHQIDTGEERPVKLPPRRVPLHLQHEVSEQVKKMLDNDIIQPSRSPWAAPVVLVRKKDGSLRFCVDYRKLNDLTRKDAYPLPRIDDALDILSKSCWFSTLDLASGYWQVEMDPQDKPKTAFTTRQGLFEFNVMPFGLCNSPGTFQRLMDLVLADLQWVTSLVYLDDIVVFGRSFHEHATRLDEVLTKLRQANLKVKPSKCNLFATQVKYLGHIISEHGVEADPEKVDCVRQWPVPKNQTEVRSFVGLASYYRRFMKGFADIARPLHQLTEKGRRFKWTEPCQTAFESLKLSLMTAPVLAYPDPHKPFILDTDASDTGIGAVLSQEEGGQEQVIAYASRALSKQERKYATTKKELLSMVTFTQHFKHYLLGKEFVLRTDHNSLRWLHNFQGVEGQLARWLEQLARFQYQIVHRPGRVHSNADALSRLPAFMAEQSPVNQTIGAIHACPKEPQGLEDELAQAQREDVELQQIIALKTGKSECVQPPRELQRFAPVWSQLNVQGSRLVRVPPSNSDAANHVQVVLPKALVPKVLEQLHNSVTAGHLGVQKLQAKVKDRFYWLGWFGDVKRWCQECVDCGSQKTSGAQPRAPLQSIVASRPFERVALDILGPLPETLNKNKYILVIGDYFSKWTESFPIPNQEAQTVAKVLVEQWVCRLGTPRSIHTDQGRQFESHLFKEMCQLLKMQKTRTSPYHAESDGMIERFNRTLISMLALFVQDNQTNWDVLLPYVMLAYRSSVHTSTGFTPYKVLFGQEIILPVDLMLNVGKGETVTSVTEYVSKLAETLSTVMGAVRGHQARASGRQKEAYDVRVKWQYYSEGELVWVRSKAKKRGVCPKLQRRFKGPYRVLERVTEVLYRLVLVEGGPEITLHFNRLKPCLSPVPERNHQEAAPGEQTGPTQSGTSGAAGWTHWRIPTSTTTPGGGDVRQPDRPATLSQGAGERDRQTGVTPARTQPSAEPSVMPATATPATPAARTPAAGTPRSSSRRAPEGGRRSRGSTIHEDATTPSPDLSGQQVLTSSRQVRKRRLPGWASDYEFW